MAHIHEKIDFTTTIFITNQNRVLLRKHEKYAVWTGPGGHIELDEDANATALREVKEEVGLDVTLIPPPYWHIDTESSAHYRELVPPMFMNIHRINEVHQHHDLIFIAKSETDTVVPEHPDDIWQWCTREDIQNHKDLEPRVREYALFALTLVAK